MVSYDVVERVEVAEALVDLEAEGALDSQLEEVLL